MVSKSSQSASRGGGLSISMVTKGVAGVVGGSGTSGSANHACILDAGDRGMLQRLHCTAAQL